MNNPLSSVVSEDVIDDIYIDLDGVTADFDAALVEHNAKPDEFKLWPGSYLWLQPMPEALESIKVLRHAFPERVWFLTKPPKYSPYAYGEKALWVRKWLGEEGLHNLIVTQHKGKVGTAKSILIDDRPHKGGVDKFRGTVIHFASVIDSELANKYPDSVEPEKVLGWSETLAIINCIGQRASTR